MSRSYRKTPIHGFCGSSEKEDKKIWHRKMRKAENNKLATVDREQTEYTTTLPEDVSNPWSMSKDGKCRIGSKDLRKAKLNPRHCDAAIANLDDKFVRYTWIK